MKRNWTLSVCRFVLLPRGTVPEPSAVPLGMRAIAWAARRHQLVNRQRLNASGDTMTESAWPSTNNRLIRDRCTPRPV